MRSMKGFVLEPLLLSALTLAQSNTVPVSNHNVAGSSSSASSSSHTMAPEQFVTRFKQARIKSESTTTGVSFAPVVEYSSGGYGPASVAVADVNGDGKPDIVVANFCGSSCGQAGTVGVLLGNGDGTFRTAVTYGSGGYNASSVAIADVNGDGKPDIVVANSCGSSSSCTGPVGTVGVLLGNGDGTFQTAVTYDSGGINARGVAIADVNGDGKPDLLVINESCSSSTTCSSIQSITDGAVGVLLNNGNGTFQTAVAYDSGGIIATSIAVGDLNGDGKPDLVVAQCSGTAAPYCNPNYSEVGVMLGNGDGTFQTALNYGEDPNSIGPNTVALADLNGDGDLDILVTNPATGDKGQYDSSLAVLLGKGDGTFQTVVTYDGGAGAADGLAIADLTGNGKLDAVVAETENTVTGAGSYSVAVFPGNGDGTFQSPVLYSAPAWAVSVVAAALVGSGLPDLVVGTSAQINSNSVGVLINTSTTAILSPASLNFAPQAPGISSSPQTITLSNIGLAAISISGIAISGTDASGFAETNDCPSALAVNSSCQIKVTSVPNGAGGQTAELSVSDNLPGSPQTAVLTGIGQGFSLGVSPTTTTVTAGQAGNYTLTVSPLNGFAQKIVFSCSGAPSNSTCSVSPASVTLNGSASMTANVAIVTAGTSASLGHFYGFPPAGNSLGLWLAWPGLLGVVLLSGRSSRSHKRLSRLLNGTALIGILSLALTWPACGGGGGGSQTPMGTYNVVLTGTYTSGTVTVAQKVKVTLVVQ
jgi:FG-GAP-like repeat